MYAIVGAILVTRHALFWTHSRPYWMKMGRTMLASPRPSPEFTADACVGEPWPLVEAVGAEARATFARDGFLIVPRFATPEVLEVLSRETDEACQSLGAVSAIFRCHATRAWLLRDVARDFLYYGPVGKFLADLLDVGAVRIHQDGFLIYEDGDAANGWHADTPCNQSCVFGSFSADTKAAQLYIALTDFDPHARTLAVVPGSHTGTSIGDCPPPDAIETTEESDRCKKQIYDRYAKNLSLRAGDAVIFHPWLLHKTQHGPGTSKSWYARVVEGDAKWLGWQASNCYDLVLSQLPYCSHDLQPGEQAKHVCYQQIYPLDQEDVVRRMDENFVQQRLAGWTIGPKKKLPPCSRTGMPGSMSEEHCEYWQAAIGKYYLR